jgi:hypothetical protein
MAHITSIGAGIFSALAINKTEITDVSTITSKTSSAALADLVAKFATAADFAEVRNVREFPQIGTPANIVNVPVYGQKTSSQIQGQADAPTLELTINYIPSDWTPESVLGALVGDGKVYAFQFSLLNAKPAGLTTTAGTAGLGSVANSNFYWVGKVEALLVSPQLTDANQATLTLSILSDFYGPGTVAASGGGGGD